MACECVLIAGGMMSRSCPSYLRYALSAGDEKVAQRLVDALHLVRAFGNAKTILNHDSNRYGLSVRVGVDGTGKAVTGFEYSAFAFQQTRLLMTQSDQRNFHVFYYLLAHLDADTKRRFLLEDDVIAYTYLNRTGCLRAAQHNDKAGYDRLRRVRHEGAMKRVPLRLRA